VGVACLSITNHDIHLMSMSQVSGIHEKPVAVGARSVAGPCSHDFCLLQIVIVITLRVRNLVGGFSTAVSRRESDSESLGPPSCPSVT
jgi:hypothetical protein